MNNYSLIAIKVVWVNETALDELASGFEEESFFHSTSEGTPDNIKNFLDKFPGAIFFEYDGSVGDGFGEYDVSVFDYEVGNVDVGYILESDIEFIFACIEPELLNKIAKNKESDQEYDHETAIVCQTFLHSIVYSGPDYWGECDTEYSLVGPVDIQALGNSMITGGQK